jgi:hypothetical protein
MELKLRMQLAQRTKEPLYFIFLDLKKAYDTLDRSRTLEILKGYGVGFNVRRVIESVWKNDTMIPKQAGFYGMPFTASRGVRQGDIMSPIVFNIVTDAVIRESISQFCRNDPSRQELVQSLFYADDGVLIGNDNQEVQFMLELYTTIFASVGLKMNVDKTKAMIMNGGKISPKLSSTAYLRKVAHVGPTFREIQKQDQMCELCGTTIKRGSMKQHQTTQRCNSSRKEYQKSVLGRMMLESQDMSQAECQSIIDNRMESVLADNSDQVVVDNSSLLPRSYTIDMDNESLTPCPVLNCPYTTELRQRMRVHFRNMHIDDTIIIAEEGPLPRCTNCGLFQLLVGKKHQETATCIKYSKIKKDRELDLVNKITASNTIFMINNQPIENVTEFKYLGRYITNNDNDWKAVTWNIKRARMAWGRLARILSSEGATPKAMASIYKAVVQAVLLYGSESWAVTVAMGKRLQSFHHRCARYISGQHIRMNVDGTWTCPSSESVLKQTGLWTIDEYLLRRRETIKKYVIGTEIYKKCMASKPLASNPKQLVWWDLNNDRIKTIAPVS